MSASGSSDASSGGVLCQLHEHPDYDWKSSLLCRLVPVAAKWMGKLHVMSFVEKPGVFLVIVAWCDLHCIARSRFNAEKWCKNAKKSCQQSNNLYMYVSNEYHGPLLSPKPKQTTRLMSVHGNQFSLLAKENDVSYNRQFKHQTLTLQPCVATLNCQC